MNDLELLRKYEPVARFTKGESFFPISVNKYVAECSLWLTDPQGKDRLLVPSGQLDIDSLVNFDEIPADHTMHLRFVDKPLEGLKYQRWLRDPKRERFVAPGRLMRVPLIFRLADSLFNFSLLIRGQVPGGQAAAADLKNRSLFSRDHKHNYYGRVLKSGGWIALHYLFFYSMNNWRSGFYGVNDHEADWEQIFVYLTDPEAGEPEPRWIAYASHDYKGDNLRRRWDDPKVVREGNHPVIFVGAGSHASYFEQGEYLMGVEPEILQPLKQMMNWLQKFWNETLGMGSSEFAIPGNRARLRVPFIDYARGDGLSIGPGQPETWEPELMTEDAGWINNYRGLWGLDTRDPIGGERAPAGPKYNRKGLIRQSWSDPIGWAGLDKVFPPHQLQKELDNRLTAVQSELAALNQEKDTVRDNLRRQALDVEALKVTEYFSFLKNKKEEELKKAQEALQEIQARRMELVETKQALAAFGRRLKRGELGSPTSHLHHVHHPEPPLPPQHRLVEIWGALSGGMILLVIVLLLIFQPDSWLLWLIGLGVGLGGVEALTRGHLVNYLLNIIIILAVIAAVILVIEFWIWILVLALMGVVVFMIRGNLIELKR